MQACRYGHKKMVKLLIKTEGFNSLNNENSDGDTPFMSACLNGHKEIVKLFLLGRPIHCVQ